VGNVIVTASSAALVHVCAYSFRADVAPTLPVEAPSERRNGGMALGLLSEAFVNGGNAGAREALAKLSEEELSRVSAMWHHLQAWYEAHLPKGASAERAFVYSPAFDQAREIDRKAHRDYSSATPTEVVAGTADLVWIDADCETVVVADIKTTVEGAPEVDATAQLEWLALMAARAYGFDAARTITLKVTEGGVEAIDHGVHDMFALADIAARLVADVAAIPSAEPKPGGHCMARYCKARLVCPATVQAIQAPIPVEALTRFRMELLPSSPEHAAWMWPRIQLAEKWIESAKESIKDMARTAPIDLGDGTELRETTSSRTTASIEKLKGLAVRLGATEEQIAACSSGATFRQVRALKKRANLSAGRSPKE
jgi:hypothetical protein